MKKLTRRFPIGVILAAVMGVVLGLVINETSDFVNGPMALVGLWLVLLLLLAIYVIYQLRKPDIVSVKFGTPITVLPNDERYRRKALVSFVSLYNPLFVPKEEQLEPARRLEAAKALDYQSLRLMDSNLEPTIHAILSHHPNLTHCWLIGTSSTNAAEPGSADFVAVLQEYLKKEHKVTAQFHCGPQYCGSIENDEQICVRTHDVVTDALKECATLGLRPDEVIIDITSGFRTMGLGAILAGLDEAYDIEFVGTHFDANGRIKPHGLATMVFPFEPILPPQR